MVWILLFLIASAAFALSAVSGGGAGLIVMPALGLLVAPEQIPAALSIGTAVSSASRIAVFWRAIRWKVVIRFVPLALPAAWGGVWMLSRLNPMYLNMLLGVFLIGNLPLLFRKRPADRSEPQGNAWHILPLIGAGAGFISGFTGAVGLLFNGFYYRLGLRKEEIVATRAANDILLHVTKVGLYISYGLVTETTLQAGAAVAVAAVISSVLLRHLLKHISDRVFRAVGHAAACVAGAAMLFIAGHQIAVHDKIAAAYSRQTQEIAAALRWRGHIVSIELENPAELELHHVHLARETGLVPGREGTWYRKSVLHISPVKGIYVTRRLLQKVPVLGS